MKRFFCAVLSLMLSVTMSATGLVLAHSETKAADSGHVFVANPKEILIKKGSSFTLRAEVQVPEGLEVDYVWHFRRGIPDKTTDQPSLTVSPDDAFYPSPETPTPPEASVTETYHLEIFDRNNGDEERTQLGKVLFNVTIKGDVGDLMKELKVIGTLVLIGPVAAIMPSLFTTVLLYPILVLYSSIAIPIGMVCATLWNYAKLKVPK